MNAEPLEVVERLLSNVPRLSIAHTTFDICLALMIISPRILYAVQALLIAHLILDEAVALYRDAEDINLKNQVRRYFWLAVNAFFSMICLDRAFRTA